jgi:DNA-binding transcriptional ArsR family regulator
MTQASSHREFKDRLYGQLARVGKALASPQRLELLELLAQGERSVEALANEMGLPIANASQHLQVLREAGLVASRKQGLFVQYRLGDDSVVALSKALRTTAEQRLAELDRIVRDHFSERSEADSVSMKQLLDRLRSKRVVVLDARPALEFAAGHIAGALSFPIDELKRRLGELPKTKEIVAYCRGPYCVYADRAVELLRKSGRRASRLGHGFPEWKSAGYPIAQQKEASS